MDHEQVKPPKARRGRGMFERGPKFAILRINIIAAVFLLGLATKCVLDGDWSNAASLMLVWIAILAVTAGALWAINR